MARVLMGEKVFARRERPVVVPGELGLQGVVERVARLLVPKQVVRLQRLGVGERGLEVEAAVRVDGKVPALAHHLENGLDPASVLVQRGAADLHLHDAEAALAIAAHLGLELVEVLARIVVAAGGVDPDPVVGLAAAIAAASRRHKGWPAIFATASQTAMSSVPTATERSPCPPGFSFRISTAQIRNGSRLPLASSISGAPGRPRQGAAGTVRGSARPGRSGRWN